MKFKGKKAEPAKPVSSGTFRVRKRDGVELEKKTVWLETQLARQLDHYCVDSRLDMSEIVAQLLIDFFSKKR